MDDDAVHDLIEVRSSLSRIFEEIKDTRRTTAGVHVSPETALESTAILACVRVLAESFASLPANLCERVPGKGKRIAEEQWLHEVLHFQPNSWMTSFEWRELMMSWVLLWGNAYSLIKPGSKGAVTELIPLHPSRMEVKRLTNGKLRYYYTEPTSDFAITPAEPTEYRQDEIFHIRWLSTDGVKGFVPTVLSREAIGLARATELYTASYFGNGAKAGTYIEVDTPQKPEALRTFKNQWEEAHRGPDKAFKTVIMPHGFHKKEDPVRNDSAELIATRRLQLEEICRVYRVPPHMVGDLVNVRFNTVEQGAIDFRTFSLMPWCRRWEGACRRDLVADDKRFFVEFDLNALMAGDYEAMSKHLREAFNCGAIDIDEYREAIGYNPLADGQGKKRFVQVNMQLLEAFTAETPTGQSATSPTGQAGALGDPAAREAVFTTALRRIAAVEADGILERRNKPEKLTLWLTDVSDRIRTELRDAAMATGRDIDDFAVKWMEKSKDLLLDCLRSGQKYESVMETWCDRHLENDA
jgi:HK97 family phage portal protein